MEQKIPLKIYLRVGALLPFFILMIWYFSFRLMVVVIPFISIKTCIAISFVISAMVSLLVVKPTIRKEMENVDEPFSLVARDPEIPLVKEKLTLKVALTKTAISNALAFLICLPLVIIGIIKFFLGSVGLPGLWELFTGIYVYFYISLFVVTMFYLFVIHPQIRNWHWTKHQY